jgi:tRNA dimethylallyltransferase
MGKIEHAPFDSIMILGPTASGKTKLAVALAKYLNAEIISVDSRQLYRGMDIGTGKDLAEYGPVPYHLIDILDAGQKADVAWFQEKMLEVFYDLSIKNKTPIFCGGSGLYLSSVLEEMQFTAVKENANLRQDLEALSKMELVDRLNRVNTHNLDFDFDSRKRLIRAIEICETGIPFGLKKPMPNPLIFGLDPELEIRRKRISKRLKARMEAGMLAEVEMLLSKGVSHETLQYYGLEYKYLSLFISGKMSKEACLQKLETEIHRYAKRQMTYFRSMEKKGHKMVWLEGAMTINEQVAFILSEFKKV